MPRARSAIPSARSAIPSARSAIPSARSAIPSVRSAIPSVRSAIPTRRPAWLALPVLTLLLAGCTASTAPPTAARHVVVPIGPAPLGEPQPARDADSVLVTLVLRDVSVEEAFASLARQSRRNFAVEPGIETRVWLRLHHVDWDLALRYLLDLSGCEAERFGERSYVITQPPRISLR